MPRLRLFIGSFLPPDLQDQLGRLQETQPQLSDLWQRKIRFVKAEKLHMTWAFLGQCDKELIPKILDLLSSAVQNIKQMTVCYEQSQFWPNAKAARNLVLEPYLVPTAVENLAATLRDDGKQLGLQVDSHPFRPHITLLRLEPPGSGLEATMGHLEIPAEFHNCVLLPLIHKMTSICLIESHWGSGQDQYDIIQQFDLPA